MPGLSPSQEVLDSPEYGVLTKYLAGDIQTEADALDAFCQPIENKYMQTANPPDVEGLLWRAWESVVAVAASTAYGSRNRQKLADSFMLDLLYRPTLSKDGQDCVVEGMTVWRDLPVFGWELREAWDLAATSNSDDKSKEQWVDINAFTATLVSCIHSNAQNKPDYSLFCIWTVRSGLEEQDPSGVAVAAAAVWFIYTASTMWDYCAQEKSFDGKVAVPGQLFNDQSWTGFTKDRWKAWAQRLEDLEGSISDEKTLKLVQEAKSAMGKYR